MDIFKKTAKIGSLDAQTTENERRNSSPPQPKPDATSQKPKLLIAPSVAGLERRWTDGEVSNTQSGQTRRPKKDSRRFQVEPKEITFNIAVNKLIDLSEQMKIMNYSCHPIYFTSRSTAVDLRPEPATGIIKPFDTVEISIMHTSSKIFKSISEKKSRNRITFEWIPLPIEILTNLNKAVTLRNKTPPENRFRHSFYVNYVIQQKNDVSPEMVERCRTALFLPELVILSGDFEKGEVCTTFSLMNETDCKVIWHFGEMHNVLLSILPHQGILNPKQSELITLKTQQFHVGNISKISDRISIEWTAAINELVQYSDMALEDAPKIFKYTIKVTYRFIKTKIETLHRRVQ